MAQDSSMAPPDGYNMEPETANGYESYPPETVDGWANDQQMPGPGGMGAGPGGMASALKRGPPPGALDFYGGGGAGGMGLPYDANAMYGMTQDGYGGVVGNGNKRQRGSSYNGAGTVLVGPKVCVHMCVCVCVCLVASQRAPVSVSATRNTQSSLRRASERV